MCRELATEIAILGARRLALGDVDSRTRRELPTDLIVHVPLQTLAITAHSGIPLFTYGTFHLDEALVTGILSAFNSLSEEVFGAQVHKTQLAEGQVLSFVHARHTVTMAVFDEEPSPVQLRLLRDLVDDFEARNSHDYPLLAQPGAVARGGDSVHVCPARAGLNGLVQVTVQSQRLGGWGSTHQPATHFALHPEPSSAAAVVT